MSVFLILAVGVGGVDRGSGGQFFLGHATSRAMAAVATQTLPS
jgi:hypothetical protein